MKIFKWRRDGLKSIMKSIIVLNGAKAVDFSQFSHFLELFSFAWIFWNIVNLDTLFKNWQEIPRCFQTIRSCLTMKNPNLLGILAITFGHAQVQFEWILQKKSLMSKKSELFYSLLADRGSRAAAQTLLSSNFFNGFSSRVLQKCSQITMKYFEKPC